RVVRVLPGMQSAFIDVGLERAAFLHVADIWEERHGSESERQIEQILHEGQSLMVQVIKDPIGSKGARLTTQISLPSRYLVLLPRSRTLGVSARIEDEAERGRLKQLVQGHAERTGCGYIVRTNAEGQPAEALDEDVAYLAKAWAELQAAAPSARVGARLYEDLGLPLRALRDLMRANIEKVRIDSRETWEKALAFARTYMPAQLEHIEHYPGERPLFDLYGIEDEIQKALHKHVPLKSGGHLVIDQTEAMTTVDVNTGGYLGHRNLEETVYRTNLEAAQAMARQLRLRNLGGIIIIDFIDMENTEHREMVLEEFRKALSRDHTKMTINGFTALGLVEMTRKRTRESLAHLLCEPCPTCSGRGEVKTARTVAYEILRELLREARQFNAKEFRVLAAPNVIDLFLDEESQSLAMLSDFIGKKVSLHAEASYTQEQYDIVLL
ncbi:MAG TPA: ribonuclease G, partial [Thauera sp.]|nr:ribonuclease G [Thauera sp.]